MVAKIVLKSGELFPGTRLTYIEDYPSETRRKVSCQCSCGNKHVTVLDSIRIGHTKSCGCLHLAIVTTKGGVASNAGRHWLYNRWQSMLQRCNNANHPNYKCYGAKGIRVCSLWHDFEKFALWVENVEGMAPQFDFEIHREDATKNYGPKNCICLPTAEHDKIEAERKRGKNVSIC